MATIKGIWLFNNIIEDFPLSTNGNGELVNFISDEKNYTYIGVYNTSDNYIYLTYDVGENPDGYGIITYMYQKGSTSSHNYCWQKESYKTIDFGDTEQTVSDEFYTWFTANAKSLEEKIETTITYNETTTTITEGQTATLKCKDKKMTDDIIVSGKCNIIYNYVVTEVVEGQTATLKCKDKKMVSDVEVEAVKAQEITHYLYNGVKLPKIPQDILSEYPYAWIRDNTESNQYQLILASYPWYYNSSMYCSGGNNVPVKWYNIDKTTANSATEWIFNKEATGGFGVSSTRPIMWSNHHIPNGSATATVIYFEGTNLVPAD